MLARSMPPVEQALGGRRREVRRALVAGRHVPRVDAGLLGNLLHRPVRELGRSGPGSRARARAGSTRWRSSLRISRRAPRGRSVEPRDLFCRHAHHGRARRHVPEHHAARAHDGVHRRPRRAAAPEAWLPRNTPSPRRAAPVMSTCELTRAAGAEHGVMAGARVGVHHHEVAERHVGAQDRARAKHAATADPAERSNRHGGLGSAAADAGGRRRTTWWPSCLVRMALSRPHRRPSS